MNTGRAPSAPLTAIDKAILMRRGLPYALDLLNFDRLEAFDMYIAEKVKVS